MKDLRPIVEAIERELDEKDAVREVAVKASRAINRLSGLAIRGLHRGEAVEGLLAGAREEASKLKSVLADHPDIYHSGLVDGAHQELVEASLSYAILHGKGLPTPQQLGVTASSYLLGLGDTVGELRRFALENLRSGGIPEATAYLAMMEEIYDELMRFDHPTGLVAIKRKQDVARGLVEKTRGELAVAARGWELEKKLERASRRG